LVELSPAGTDQVMDGCQLPPSEKLIEPFCPSRSHFISRPFSRHFYPKRLSHACIHSPYS
jgi:hypothetical protein